MVRSIVSVPAEKSLASDAGAECSAVISVHPSLISAETCVELHWIDVHPTFKIFGNVACAVTDHVA